MKDPGGIYNQVKRKGDRARGKTHLSKLCFHCVGIKWLYLSAVAIGGHRKGSSCPLWALKSQLKLATRADQFPELCDTLSQSCTFPTFPFLSMLHVLGVF